MTSLSNKRYLAKVERTSLYCKSFTINFCSLYLPNLVKSYRKRTDIFLKKFGSDVDYIDNYKKSYKKIFFLKFRSDVDYIDNYKKSYKKTIFFFKFRSDVDYIENQCTKHLPDCSYTAAKKVNINSNVFWILNFKF